MISGTYTSVVAGLEKIVCKTCQGNSWKYHPAPVNGKRWECCSTCVGTGWLWKGLNFNCWTAPRSFWLID